MAPALREFVRQRAGYRCEYCHVLEEFSELRFHIEHIIPLQHQGDDSPENLALACPDCNLRKGTNLTALDPKTGEAVSLFNPRRNQWNEHFEYEGANIKGTSSIGRTTVRLLAMNDPERLRIRTLLREMGDLI